MLALASVGDLNAAFAAVYGDPPPITREVKIPDGPSESLVATPVDLVSVGAGRFALIVREANGQLSHAATGAASVAYVERAPAGATTRWRRVGRWDHIAFDGETGGVGMTLKVRRDLGPRPLVFMDGPSLFTGDAEDDVVVVRLDPKRPVPIGRISLRSSDEDGLDNRHARYGYWGRVVLARPPALFAVRYDGWHAEAGSDEKQPFQGRVAFGLKGGCLTPLGPTPAPEIMPSYTLRGDCASARAATVR